MYDIHQHVPITTLFFSAMLAAKEIAGGEKLVEEASRMENSMREAIESQVGRLFSLPCVPFGCCSAFCFLPLSRGRTGWQVVQA